jgi:tripartite-type tricarboxylate transporter receptor subunit TctC
MWPIRRCWRRAERSAVTNPMRGILFSIVACATGAALAAVPPGADYPVRPVRMVVTFTAGGTPDAIARIVAGQMERQLGQSFVVDNRAGANAPRTR